MDQLPGYPTSFGNKKVITFDMPGPDYYFTGGTEYSVDDLGIGFGGIDSVKGSVSQSGTYRAEARFGSSVEGEAAQVFRLVVTAVANGNEVAYGIDLGAEVFRLEITGV